MDDGYGDGLLDVCFGCCLRICIKDMVEACCVSQKVMYKYENSDSDIHATACLCCPGPERDRGRLCCYCCCEPLPGIDCGGHESEFKIVGTYDKGKLSGYIIKRPPEQIVDASNWTPGTESKVWPVDDNGKLTADI